MPLFFTKFNTKDNQCYNQRKFLHSIFDRTFSKEGKKPKDPDEIQLTYSI